MNVKDIRRTNLRRLADDIGGVTALSKCLGKSQSQISHLIGTRPIKNIGDRLAAHIEKVFNKTHGWLDREHFFVAEECGIYVIENQNYRPICWAPVIGWDDVHSWKQNHLELSKNAKISIPVQADNNSRLFALQIQNDVIVPQDKIHIPSNALVVIDPNKTATSGAVVVASAQASSQPKLGSYQEKDGTKMIKCFNNGETIKFSDHVKLYGTLKQVVVMFS